MSAHSPAGRPCLRARGSAISAVQRIIRPAPAIAAQSAFRLLREERSSPLIRKRKKNLSYTRTGALYCNIGQCAHGARRAQKESRLRTAEKTRMTAGARGCCAPFQSPENTDKSAGPCMNPGNLKRQKPETIRTVRLSHKARRRRHGPGFCAILTLTRLPPRRLHERGTSLFCAAARPVERVTR